MNIEPPIVNDPASGQCALPRRRREGSEGPYGTADTEVLMDQADRASAALDEINRASERVVADRGANVDLSVGVNVELGSRSRGACGDTRSAARHSGVRAVGEADRIRGTDDTALRSGEGEPGEIQRLVGRRGLEIETICSAACSQDRQGGAVLLDLLTGRPRGFCAANGVIARDERRHTEDEAAIHSQVVFGPLIPSVELRSHEPGRCAADNDAGGVVARGSEVGSGEVGGRADARHVERGQRQGDRRGRGAGLDQIK